MFDYQNPALPVKERVADLLSRMTLAEKAAQTCMMRGVEYATKPDPRQHCSVEPDTEFDWDRLAADFDEDGIGFIHDMYSTPVPFNKIQKYFIEHSRLGIPVIFTGEALHGISGVRGTVFPCPLNFGATFDPELVHEVGEAIGRETRALGMYEILAPNLDVARESRWGRIEETFGEDTYLSSRMAAAIVSGEQKGDISRPDAVIAEPKHYCVHGIAEGGTNCAPARAGRREVESSYLPVFEAGICEGGAYNVMVSYNCVDGDPLMCSEWYLKDVLKDRFQLKGYARSDWGGVGRLKHTFHMVETDEEAIGLAMRNGLDVQGCDYDPTFWKKSVIALVEAGKLTMERLDDIVSRVLRVKFELGLFDHPFTDEHLWESVIRCEKHREVSHEVARKSVVMLKNNGVLPLKKDLRSVALIGPSSAAQKIGGYSSTPQFEIPSVYEELKAALGEGVTVRQCNGCAITYDKKQPRVVDGQPHLYSEGEDEIADEMDEAVSIASTCDAVIFIGGDNTITSGEGRDRCELTLNGRQRELIERLAELGKPLVLVLENGKPLEISRENEICDAILMAFYGGESGARAIVEVLTGAVNPSGRLPISLPRSSTRIPCYYSMLPGGAPDFLEGPKNALFPFGYGLSYTQFEYSNLEIDQLADRHFMVHCYVKNTGSMDGDEVVQLYIDDTEGSVVRPPMLLKEFKRIHLKAGEEKPVFFPLTPLSFRLMDIHYEWKVEPGRFRILVGAGSRDIRLEGEITITK